MKNEQIDFGKTGQFYIDFFTSIHGENPFEIRFLSNYGYHSESLLRCGDYVYSEKLVKGKGPEKKAQWCSFNPEEFGKAIIDKWFEISTIGGGCSVLFTVNSPNFEIMDRCETKDEHITDGGRINAQFVDIDAPKDIRADKEQLKQFKHGVALKIKAFSPEPSGVIETKHGYHVYWFVNDAVPHLFRHVQMQLVEEFGGDMNCINESRTLRLPYFQHVKDPNDPFPVTIKRWNPEVTYSQMHLKDNLPELSEATLIKLYKQHEAEHKSNMSTSRKDAVLNLVLDKISATGGNENKIITHCCMPNHPDKRPSAWIDKDYMFYHCSRCGIHVHLEELAKELEWQDVLDEINRYDIDLGKILEGIKSKAVNVSELVQSINVQEQKLIDTITETVIEDFTVYNQEINDRHAQYIQDIVTLLVKSSDMNKPALIPLDMGGGKSTIIKVFLQQMLNHKNDYGAVVVVDRIATAKKLEEDINDYFSSNKFAFAMYGFLEDECLDNIEGNAKNSHCPVFTTNYKYHCSYTQDCRYYSQNKLQKQFPVLIITKKRLSMDFNKLVRYRFFGENDEKQRNVLLFDEKPSIVTVKELNRSDFYHFNSSIQNSLDQSENPSILAEFENAIEFVEPLFADTEKRELFEANEKGFRFSEDFYKEFRNQFPDYTKEISDYPHTLEAIIRNGGHIKPDEKYGVKIITSVYRDYAKIAGFKTFIFDGTADLDLEYNHDNYNLINFEPIRTYEKLEIKICDLISASRTSLSDFELVKAFCEDVISICEGQPQSKVYIPTFMSNENEIVEYLRDYIDNKQVMLAHYGATKGTNEFKDCDIVAICGILHKTENHYTSKAQAIYEQNGEVLEEIELSKYNNVRRFNDTRIEAVKLLDMLADYSQEIKRSSQRNNAQNVKGTVYIFHNDKILLEHIGLKFPNCSISEWYPQKMIENRITTKGNNPKQTAFIDFINESEAQGKTEIWYEQIRSELDDMPTKGFSKLITNTTIQAFLTSRGYVEVKEGRRKKLVKS